MHKVYRWILLPAVLFALVVTGCETTPGPKAAIGGLGGATAGGLLAAVAGGDAAAIAAGTILGGLIGGAIGDRLDAADRQQMQQATKDALEKTPAGTPVEWHNPDSGNHGSVTPVRTYRVASGQYCREYEQTVNVDGEIHKAFYKACRQSDGTWQLVK